ncbi:uncharacterized protein LOC113932226 [Zalophus californianus]|uniref:Uncharacterized protein LOC113932226 n=1 Tax=Zalophus californianus TaxID=9704 RepID=A0A6J2EET5_ZALCA|nr:uncharacterized protein LOC113932226 [Zalophus californianus]
MFNLARTHTSTLLPYAHTCSVLHPVFSLACSHVSSLAHAHTSTLLPRAHVSSLAHTHCSHMLTSVQPCTLTRVQPCTHTSTLLPHAPTCSALHTHKHTAPTCSQVSSLARSHVTSLVHAHTSTLLPHGSSPASPYKASLWKAKAPEVALWGPQLRSAGLMGTSPSTSGAAGWGQHGHPAWREHFITIHTADDKTRRSRGRTRPIYANLPTPIFQGRQWGRAGCLLAAVEANPPTTPSAPVAQRKKPQGYSPEGLWAHRWSAECQLPSSNCPRLCDWASLPLAGSWQEHLDPGAQAAKACLA